MSTLTVQAHGVEFRAIDHDGVTSCVLERGDLTIVFVGADAEFVERMFRGGIAVSNLNARQALVRNGVAATARAAAGNGGNLANGGRG